jgi:hypothetical protein
MIQSVISTISQKFNEFQKNKQEAPVQPSQTNYGDKFRSYLGTAKGIRNQLTQELDEVRRPRTRYQKVDIEPIKKRFTGFQDGVKEYWKDVDTSPVAQKFKDYWQGDVQELGQYSANAQKAGLTAIMPLGFTNLEEKKQAFDKVSAFKPLGVPVGSALRFLNEEPDEVTLAREKVFRGEAITEKEKRMLDDGLTNLVIGASTSLESAGSKLPKIARLANKEEAIQKLDYLLNGQKKLMEKGMSAKAAFLTKWPEYKQIFNQFKTITNPKAKPFFDTQFAKWIGKREAAQTIGLKYGSALKEVPEEMGMQIIHKLETPSLQVAPEVEVMAIKIKGMYDELYKTAKGLNLDVGYLNNYVTHIWEQTPEEVAIKMQTLGKKFSGPRSIPTYAEGISLGLTPKYTNPSQIVASYAGRMQQISANLDFFNALKGEGLITDVSKGIQNGWRPISAPGFPQSVAKGSAGEVVRGSYYAQPEIAELINRIFSPESETTTSKVMSFFAKANQGVQDFSLSGGLPKTPVNAFSIMAGLQKEWLAGKPISSTLDFVRSFSRGKSIKFFEENADVIQRMQASNIPLQTEWDMKAIVNRTGLKGFVTNQFGENVGEAWTKTMNEPTFKRFLPMLQINTFKSIEKAALKQGMNADEAAATASKAVQNFYGTVPSDVLAKRSKIGQDIVSSIFFAPRYRESLIYFWGNTLKAFANPLALENQMNLRFVVGASLAYLGMDALNQHLNGHPMRENPPGKEMMLLIPSGDTTIGVPWLSSLGFLPRSTYQSVMAGIKGDFKEVGNQLKGHSSMLLRGGLDILGNQNYWGEQITDEGDDANQRFAKIAVYLAEQYSHPYLRAFTPKLKEYLTGEKTETTEIDKLKTAAKVLELPVRFYETKKIDSAWYFDAEKEALKNLDNDELAVYQKLHKGKQIDEDGLPVFDLRSSMADAMDRLANPKVFAIEAEIARATSEKTGEALNPLYELKPEQQKVILILKTLAPGDTAKSKIIQENSWLKKYWVARDAYIDDLRARGIIKGTIDDGKPQVDKQLQGMLDFYFTLPQGTGQRTDFIKANPELKLYFDANRLYNNQKRLELGLPLLEDNDFGSSGKSSGPKPKMIEEPVPKFKSSKTTFPTLEPIKSLKNFESIRPAKKLQPKMPVKKDGSEISFAGARTLSQLGQI